MRYLFITLLALPFSLGAQTIQEIQGEVADSPFADMEVTTMGIVTAVNDLGFTLQDGEGAWSGIHVFDGAQPQLGDQVTVTGTAVEFYELTEIVNVTEVTVNSSGNALPEPQLLSTAAIADEQWESVLLRIEEGTCTNEDLGFSEFELDDGSGACRVDDAYMSSPYAAQLGIAYSVVGIQTYSFGDFKLLPRGEDDITLASPLYFTAQPEEFDLATTSLSILWETNADADTELDYGYTPAYELGTFADAATTTFHDVALTGLEPATPLYIRARSTNIEGDVVVQERVVITTSESTGTIEVLFTQMPDLSAATLSEAQWTESIADSIVSYIGLAQSTLDIAMYDLMDCDPAIIQAINARSEAGVVVRYITDDEPENLALNLLDPEIPVLAGNAEGIMHDKFILIDRDDALGAWVITGATNHTGANMGWDYNNQIRIQDQSLCRAFTLEFEEMWGSSGNSFDADNAAFASQKTDNTPHKFILGGKASELYFAPSDGTAAQISEHLAMAEDRVAFAVMAFTENSLGQAIVNANNAVGNVQGIIDYVEFSGSEFDYLVDQGVDVVDYQNEDGTEWPDGPVMHSKYAMADYAAGDANPITITGSYNWTASAGAINDENTLILFDAEIANWFYQDFLGIRNHLGAVSLNEQNQDSSELLLFPNPSDGHFRVSAQENASVQIYDAAGREVFRSKTGMEHYVDLPTGLYNVVVTQQNGLRKSGRLFFL